MKLWIVTKHEILQKEQNEVCPEEIGQKALGLCRVPYAWTLPFFVITKDLFKNILDRPQDSELIIKCYMSNILLAIDELKLGDDLIIRSSGAKEGMAERGRYESISSNRENLEKDIQWLISRMLNESELSEDGLPLIIQKYIQADIVGHISNERRFVRENRDFVYEYCMGNRIETENISLRNWRKKYDIADYINNPLILNSGWKEKLKIVCAYFYYQKSRVHIEFVCSKTELFIVQCDLESELKEAVDPDKYNIKMFEKEDVFHPQILRRVTENDKGKYRKIDNIFIYKEVGIPIPPLYILDDKECIEDFRKGKISDCLKADLTYMTKQSLVIRTNVVCEEELRTQFSKRSNELRDVDSAVEFLKIASAEIMEEGINDYIFIFHNFIPAKIAAFVNAKPLERIVEIQALWGLPEGLYYNAHDRIRVDTKDIDVRRIAKQRFNINKMEVYKECFIAPDDAGKWIVKRLMPQFNWRCTISNDEVICEIAERARKIVENVGTELSIMWFVGIDEKFYGTNNIPWYHKKYDRNNFCYMNESNIEMNFKKKYFYQKELVIETRADLQKIREQDSKTIGIVRIKPKEDDILRSKEFIKEVGTLCKQKGVNIFLEGAVLAHSFYQLVNTGATVIAAYQMKQFVEKIEFNKLVRDRIPEIIEQNGESASCITMEGIGLVRQLKNKIIEEAYEVLAANSREEVMEELADLEEVCIALEHNIKLVNCDKLDANEIGENAEELRFEGAVPEESKQVIWDKEKRGFYASLVRKNNSIQLDLFWGNDEVNMCNAKSEFYLDNDKKRILGLAFQIFSSCNSKDCYRLICEIRTASMKIQDEISCSKEEFEEVRNQKKMRKGGFEKGYILLKTNFHEEELDDLVSSEILNCKNVHKVNYDLPLKERIDVEILNTSRLLIRLTVSLFSRQGEWKIKRSKINDFFGADVDIKITKVLSDTQIIFYLNVQKEFYEQLTFRFV